MKISKKIAEKVKRYQKLKAETDKLFRELNNFFEEKQGDEGVWDFFITNKPQGVKQFNGEYCDQTTLGEDWYRGVYYHPIKNSDNYVGCRFEI